MRRPVARQVKPEQAWFTGRVGLHDRTLHSLLSLPRDAVLSLCHQSKERVLIVLQFFVRTLFYLRSEAPISGGARATLPFVVRPITLVLFMQSATPAQATAGLASVDFRSVVIRKKVLSIRKKLLTPTFGDG
ncbi:hypothetical protein D9M70_464040 [compost metagenome]